MTLATKILLLFTIPGMAIACQVANTSTGSLASTPLQRTDVSGCVVDVPGNAAWGETGIRLTKGQEFQVTFLSGAVVDGHSAVPDASGSGYVCGNAGCCEPMPSAPRDALIGRIGREIFYVGNGGEFSAPSSGSLELRINDCDSGLYDNRGSLRVIVLP